MSTSSCFFLGQSSSTHKRWPRHPPPHSMAVDRLRWVVMEAVRPATRALVRPPLDCGGEAEAQIRDEKVERARMDPVPHGRLVRPESIDPICSTPSPAIPNRPPACPTPPGRIVGTDRRRWPPHLDCGRSELWPVQRWASSRRPRHINRSIVRFIGHLAPKLSHTPTSTPVTTPHITGRTNSNCPRPSDNHAPRPDPCSRRRAPAGPRCELPPSGKCDRPAGPLD